MGQKWENLLIFRNFTDDFYLIVLPDFCTQQQIFDVKINHKFSDSVSKFSQYTAVKKSKK